MGRRAPTPATVLRRWVSLAAAVVIVPSVSLAVAPALAVQTGQTAVVSAVPAADTPAVNNGSVSAIAAVGTRMVVGGDFTTVSPAGDTNTVYDRPHVFAFDANTGAVDGGFLPSVNGKVVTAIPGPRADEVYIGGAFTQVDGTAMRVALLDTTSGAVVAGWKPAAIDGSVDKLVLAHGQLFAAGTFNTVGGDTHHGLATLDPTTGKVTSYVDIGFTGHHNYRTNCDPSTATCAPGVPGVRAMDADPSGKHLVVLGNFINAGGTARDQVAVLDLGKTKATVDPNWATLAYTSPCFAQSFDFYVRDVQFSPDGSYFVIVATGGVGTNSDHTDSSCDTAARFDTADQGSNVRPVWIDYSGEDTLESVSVTGAAVYVGGHQRWLNNTFGQNVAGPGAVPRPGIAALSPASGMPLTWNPGRNPRGAGVHALLATATGLWVGSDTDYIGDHEYLRPKLAFFPLAGGETPPADTTPKLPGRVFLAGATSTTAADPDRFGYREFDGKSAGKEEAESTGPAWGDARGVFEVDGSLIYGKADGNLYRRSFDGSTVGAETALDPYDDPAWDTVATGSGQTYRGLRSTFADQIPSVTSMFFAAGRLYYTVAGDKVMHWRWFEPESGVVGASEHAVAGPDDWSNIAGAFLSHDTVYFADQDSGRLYAAAWSPDRVSGKPKVVSGSTDWASRGMFVVPQSTNPTPTPVAAFTGQCGDVATCTFRATPWVDPDGGVVRYRWTFGDGSTRPLTTSPTASHRYAINGTHKVRLTVETSSGAMAATTHSVATDAKARTVHYVGVAAASGRGKHAKVAIPRRAKAGNALLLFASYASTSVRATTPKDWKLLGKSGHKGLSTRVYERVIHRHRGHVAVRMRFSHPVNSTLVVAAYRHTAEPSTTRSRVAVGGSARRHPTPALNRLRPGDWVVGYWTTTSRAASRWRLPHTMKRRASVRSRRGPVDSAVLGDADAVVGVRGSYRPGSARSTRRSRSAAQWSIALAPALR
jgi:hypothetical protein